MKADPYGNQSQLRPDNASVVAIYDILTGTDQAWRKAHQEKKTESPMAIYEVHPGSWKKDPFMPGEFYNFKLAVELADYVLEMGYTHVELIGLSEHPF